MCARVDFFHEHKEGARPPRTNTGHLNSSLLLLVKGYVSNLWHRHGPLPAAPLVVRRRYLIEVPRPMPAAPLVVRRRYLIVALWPMLRCASWVLNRGAQTDVRGAT